MTNPRGAVVNPYARKQKTNHDTGKNPEHQNRASGSSNNNSENSNALAVVEIGPAATFSQAFSSVEETNHYRKEVASLKQSRGDSNLAGDTEARAQQRAFDAEAAASNPQHQNGQQQGGDASDEMSARDHHVMLQPHVLHVSTKQRGNGVLNYIRNVPFAYSKMVPDYIMSSQRCALFLSCKYHSLNPNYIHRRIAELKTDFKLRVLLVLVDVEDNANTLLFLNKLAVVHNMSLILAWSEEEAARYLETFKAFDGKDASSIQRREQTNFFEQVTDVLGTVRSVNKTDSNVLMSQFTSLKAITAASMDELSLCPGMGVKKVRRLHDAFHKPFSSRKAKRRKEEQKAGSADLPE